MTRNGGHYCAFCGAAFLESEPWPRRCDRCEGVTEIGLITLVTVLGRERERIYGVAEHPLHDGPGPYLPATFLDFGETWRQAAARALGGKARFRAAGAMSDAAGVPRLYAECLEGLESRTATWSLVDETEIQDPFDRNFLEQQERDSIEG